MTDRPVSCVLWDLGGVLVDVDLNRSRTRWHRETGLDGASFDEAFFGSRLWEQMVLGAADEGAIVNRIGAFLAGRGGGAMARPLLVDVWNACLRPRARVVELVRRVARRVPVGVLSDTDPIHARFIRQTAGIDDIVAAWTFSFEVGVRKPDPQIYREALSRMHSEPAGTLFIDDRPENVAGARSVGLDSVLYRDVEALESELGKRRLV